VTQTPDLLADLDSTYVIADHGYAAQALVD